MVEGRERKGGGGGMWRERLMMLKRGVVCTGAWSKGICGNGNEEYEDEGDHACTKIGIKEKQK